MAGVLDDDDEFGALLQKTSAKVDELKRHMANEGLDVSTDVFTLARAGDFDKVLELLETSPELWHKVDDDSHTLIHWGALAGNFSFMQKGLSAGVAVDAKSTNGQTALMWAVIRGHIDACRVLLQARANPRAQDSLLATPLILATQYGQHGCIFLLCQRVPSEKLLEDVDVNGCSALHWAAYKCDGTTIRLFGYFDLDFGTVDNDGMTLLHRMAQGRKGNRDLTEFLLDKKVDPMRRDKEGRTPLGMAEENTDMNFAYLLRVFMRKYGYKPEDIAAATTIVKNGEDDVRDIEASPRRQVPAKLKEDKAFKSDKLMHYMAPCFWLVSVSIATLQYINDLRSASWEAAPMVALAFEIGIPLSLVLFFHTATANPGKVPPRIKSASGVEDLMRALDTVPLGDGDNIQFSRLCTTTWVLKGLRTKYCTASEACIEEFDHFCGWLNCAIGRGNQRQFILLALVEVLSQYCHIYLLIRIGLYSMPYETFWQWFTTTVMAYPLLALMLFLQGVTAPMITMLLLNHLRMLAINMTTNELINVRRYDHFWEMRGEPPRKVFVNPFSKGTMFKNCLDFWWKRKRGTTYAEILAGGQGNMGQVIGRQIV